MIRTQEEHLAHYGILRRSGRYPWGSGETQSIRNKDFLSTVADLRKQGISESTIAKSFDITTTELRDYKSIASAQQRREKILTARRLKEKGWSNGEIGIRMGGLNESSVRALLAEGELDKAKVLLVTSKVLRDHVDKKGMIQVGKGVEHQLGITRTRLNTSITILKQEGYKVFTIYVKQIGTGKFTSLKVLAKPGTTQDEVNRNRAKIELVTDYSKDHGRSYLSIQPPISINSRRIRVTYGDEGSKLDGVIYVRPGKKDLMIGANRYGQVRIAVDGTHYLKGMAVYKDDLPPGVDLVFHTKNADTGRKKDAMKEMKDDPENPFGSIIRQIHDKDGNVISAMNMVGSPTKPGSGEEGQWDAYKKALSSQVLSKQDPKLAIQQLGITYERRSREFEEINSLTNPTVRRELLKKFADSTDSAAVHLFAANMHRQATKVLIPISSIKEGEVYAPTFRDGERLALIRFPHGGTFEIPQLTVNNRNREARKMLGTGDRTRHDAIGIHHKTAAHLSGADFDGDFVLAIPNNNKAIKITPALEALKGFDPHIYKLPKDSPIPRMTPARKQMEMGKVSNLITDMTLHGASDSEKARAIKHSMVVIDAEKHELDFKQSEKDNGIISLKDKYQREGSKTGAATLISRASATIWVPHREARRSSQGGAIDPKTGKKMFVPTGRMVTVGKSQKDKVTGERRFVTSDKMKLKTVESKRLAETDDARTLIGTPPTKMEGIYADHSNRLKALANKARKEAVTIKSTPYSPSAKQVYKNEVATLQAKINIAEKNAPLEKQAQLLANAKVGLKQQAKPHMEASEVKKIKQMALNETRMRLGAKKIPVVVTQEEWNAIQAGAISNHNLGKILLNSDLDSIKRLALPKTAPKLTNTMLNRAQQMLASGYTQAEVADHFGIGLTTLKVAISE